MSVHMLHVVGFHDVMSHESCMRWHMFYDSQESSLKYLLGKLSWIVHILETSVENITCIYAHNTTVNWVKKLPVYILYYFHSSVIS